MFETILIASFTGGLFMCLLKLYTLQKDFNRMASNQRAMVQTFSAAFDAYKDQLIHLRDSVAANYNVLELRVDIKMAQDEQVLDALVEAVEEFRNRLDTLEAERD